MSNTTRRAFVKNASLAFGALTGSQLLVPRWAVAQQADPFVQAKVYDKAMLRSLAQTALEAAKSAGAIYADIRIEISRSFGFLGESGDGGNVLQPPSNGITLGIGIRAVAENGGTMGFAGEVLEFDAESVAALARVAVGRSRGGAPRKQHPFKFAPAPAIDNGFWRTPIEVDPFTIPVEQQEALVLEAFDELAKVKAPDNKRVQGLYNWFWLRQDQVFASTEGSTFEQQRYTGTGGLAARCTRSQMYMPAVVGIEAIKSGGVGYETITRVNVKEEMRRAGEEAVRLSGNLLRVRSAELGRYDLVSSSEAVAYLISETIGYPLAAERALLLAINGDGTTYAMPPESALGHYQVGSPLINISCDRSRPGAGQTVGWDTEGVKPVDFDLVKEGVVMDYLTSRGTAAELADVYRKQGKPVRSQGCAEGSGSNQPFVELPNFTLHPGKVSATEDDLIKDIKKGFFINSLFVSVDQSGLNVQAGCWWAEEIVNGKRTGAMYKDMAILFATPQFWKSVDAIGGASSAKAMHIRARSGVFSAFNCVPIRARKVSVVNTGKTQ